MLVPLLATALGLSLLGSLGGLIVASSLLLFTDSLRTRLMPWLISYAVGALLAVALLALLPEALETLDAVTAFETLLFGILLFFVLEKLVLLRHCHTDERHAHGAAAPLVLFGDAFHNFIDGATICTAVLTSVPLGVNTAIAVAAHEIPQEVGDFAILLSAGYSRRRAMLLESAVRRFGHRRRPAGVCGRGSDAVRAAVRPGGVVGESALHRDVGSHSRISIAARWIAARSARSCSSRPASSPSWSSVSSPADMDAASVARLGPAAWTSCTP